MFENLKRWRQQVIREKVSRDSSSLRELRKQVAEQHEALKRQRRYIEKKDRRIEALEKQADRSDQRANPKDLIWVFSASRSGSTWLTAMMGDLPGFTMWKEPSLGELFGDFYEKKAHRGGKHHVFGGREATWRKPLRTFLVEMAAAKFPEILDGTRLVVKESGSGIGAPLIMKALPNSPMVLLVRDPRDVVASAMDAYREGSWFRERRKSKGAPLEIDPNSSDFVESQAAKYAKQVEEANKAIEAHQGLHAIVRYEDLQSDTLAIMCRLYSDLDIPFDEKELTQVVEKHSWENIPQEKKGEGKFYRKGAPGSWKEDLTSEQVAIIEETTGSLLQKFYPGSKKESPFE